MSSEKPIQILLIEDNTDDMFLIQRLLTKSLNIRFQVQHVGSLEMGLQALAADPIDAVLLDLDLPDSKGIHTLIKAQEEVPNIPIVVLTGLDDELQGIEAVHRGAQDYLIKGKTSSDVLVRALNYAIQRKQTELELRRHRDHLEELVEERTAELVHTNEKLQCEVAERKQIEEAEREQRILAEALRDIANALNTAPDLTDVLDRVLLNIERVVPHDAAEIMLIDGAIAYVARNHHVNSFQASWLNERLDINNTPHLSYMIQTHQPLIISDLSAYAEDIRSMLLRGPEWRSYAGVPIFVKDEVIGFINLDSQTPHFFTPIHADRLQAFAEQTAIAIQNIRLHAQEQALAAAQERERLARDLHDAVSQTLFSASVISEALLRQWERDPEKARQRLIELHKLTRGALAEMRSLLLELRPTSLLDIRLGDLLRQLAEATQSRKRMAITVTADEQLNLPPDVKLTLYRIAQESLNNIVKHARASRVDITLSQDGEQTELTIVDNGRGFNPDKIAPTSLGIGIMKERAETIGASFAITTGADSEAGTQVHVIWQHL